MIASHVGQQGGCLRQHNFMRAAQALQYCWQSWNDRRGIVVKRQVPQRAERSLHSSWRCASINKKLLQDVQTAWLDHDCPPVCGVAARQLLQGYSCQLLCFRINAAAAEQLQQGSSGAARAQARCTTLLSSPDRLRSTPAARPCADWQGDASRCTTSPTMPASATATVLAGLARL